MDTNEESNTAVHFHAYFAMESKTQSIFKGKRQNPAGKRPISVFLWVQQNIARGRGCHTCINNSAATEVDLIHRFSERCSRTLMKEVRTDVVENHS